MNKYILKNGLIEQHGAYTKKNLLIENGIIAGIFDKEIEIEEDYAVIDVDGKYIFPGFIDLHVHLREPGFEYKETIATGTLAAAAGGYTQVYAMPNTNPTMDSVEAIKKFNDIIKKEAYVKTKTYAAITKGLRSEELVDFIALAKEGAIAFTNDGVGVQTSGIMYEAMQEVAKLNMPLTAHCEDNSLIYGGAFHQGKRATELGVPGIPNICESVQIARDVLLAEAANCHYHVCHVSTKESVRAIRDAKKAGIHVTAEVSPHHLLLTEEDIPDNAYENYKMNPPLRSKEDHRALLEGLLDGTIDCIATDHAPHSDEDKQKPITESAFGIIGSEQAFSLLYTYFVKTKQWELQQLIDWLTIKPAQTYNLTGGTLDIGMPADITIFDLEQSYKIEPPFISKGNNTPFIGKEVYGKTLLTIVDGKVVYDSSKKVEEE